MCIPMPSRQSAAQAISILEEHPWSPAARPAPGPEAGLHPRFSKLCKPSRPPRAERQEGEGTMVVYGVALLSACMLVGMFVGDLLGMAIGVKANVGGVGIAM